MTRAVCLFLLVAPSLAHAQFTYRPAGELVSGSGSGRVDSRVYAPGILFPIRDAPAYLNSQVWGVGGSSGPSGSQCDARNYAYPWHDNYCETRDWDMPLCPAGTGHQGQDIRGPTCMAGVNPVLAVVDGTITNIGSYSVYLTAADGTRFDYLHMGPVPVSLGDVVHRGDVVGYVNNHFGTSSTTIHCHFNIRQDVTGVGSVYVPPYMSLIRAYETLIGTGTTTPTFGAAYVHQTFPLSSDPFVLAAGATSMGYIELRNTGTGTWRPGETFLGTTQPRDVASPLVGPDWLSDHRAATIDHDVAPGETGRFTFTVRAPLTPGDYPQFFDPVEEGVTWFADSLGPPDDQIEILVTAVAGTDADGDGSPSTVDCDDADASVHPGAADICGDGIDQDCDGTDAVCGASDAGSIVPPDAGGIIPPDVDAGSMGELDGGTGMPPLHHSSGCGCHVSERGGNFLGLSLFALAVVTSNLLRRRARRAWRDSAR